MFPSLVQAHTDTSNQRQVRSWSHGHEILSSALATRLFNFLEDDGHVLTVLALTECPK